MRAKRERVIRDDARRMIVGIEQISLLQERVAQTEPRRVVVRILRKQFTEKFFRELILALAQSALGLTARLIARISRQRAAREDQTHGKGGEACDRHLTDTLASDFE